MSMEQDKEPRNRPTQIYPNSFWQRCKSNSNGGKTDSVSINGTGAIAHPLRDQKKNELPPKSHILYKIVLV